MDSTLHSSDGHHLAFDGQHDGVSRTTPRIRRTASNARCCPSVHLFDESVPGVDCVIFAINRFGRTVRAGGTFLRARSSDRLRVGWEGYHESRRCKRDTYPESCITKYTSIRRNQSIWSNREGWRYLTSERGRERGAYRGTSLIRNYPPP